MKQSRKQRKQVSAPAIQAPGAELIRQYAEPLPVKVEVVMVPPPAGEMVEICRSFAYKLNCERVDPSMRFESRDFFCSWKGQGTPDKAEEISRAAYDFCESEVLESVRAYRAYRAKMKAQRGEAA
jgi:hypothetical protein